MKIILTILLFTSSAFSADNSYFENSYSELNNTLDILSTHLVEDVSFEYLEGKKARKELKHIRCGTKKITSEQAQMYFVNLIYNASMYLSNEAYDQIDFDQTHLEFEEIVSNKKVKYCYFNGPNFDKVEYLYVRHSSKEFSVKLSTMHFN